MVDSFGDSFVQCSKQYPNVVDSFGDTPYMDGLTYTSEHLSLLSILMLLLIPIIHMSLQHELLSQYQPLLHQLIASAVTFNSGMAH